MSDAILTPEEVSQLKVALCVLVYPGVTMLIVIYCAVARRRGGETFALRSQKMKIEKITTYFCFLALVGWLYSLTDSSPFDLLFSLRSFECISRLMASKLADGTSFNEFLFFSSFFFNLFF